MKKKTLTLLLALALSLGMFTMGALAASGTRTLEVTYKDIKLVIDGQEIVPKDAAGNVVEPFQANGTTYLPVRAIGEALGKEVTWHQHRLRGTDRSGSAALSGESRNDLRRQKC